MFESICIRRQLRTGTPIDLGFLAEAMTFYRDVHVVADCTMFVYLARVCGPDSLLSAIEQGFLKLSYIENELVTSTMDHRKATARYGLHFLSAPKNEFLPFAERQFLELTGRKGKSRRLADRFAQHVTKVRWAEPEAQAAKADLLNADITDVAAKVILQEIAPEFTIPHSSIFRVNEVPDALLVETDLDLIAAKRYYRRPNIDSDFGISDILNGMFEALADLRFSASFGSELAVSPTTSAIAEVKLGQLLLNRRSNAERLRLFQDSIFAEGRAIREAINEGHRSFDEIISLVASAQKFKEWVGRQPDTVDVRQEYLRQVSKIDWADKLPAKTLRWLLLSAIGGVLGLATTPETGIITGAALNAIDAFMIDKLVKGWKPNQFVDGPLRAFVDPQRPSGSRI